MKTLNELVNDYLAENHTWCKKADGNYHFEIKENNYENHNHH